MLCYPEYFLAFADVSSHLTFKIWAWKRDCTTYFEQQIPHTSSIAF